LTPENWAYSADVATYPYDPARAGDLLDQAGYPRRTDGSRGLRFVYKTTPEGAPLAEALQAMLGRVGIGLSIRINEWATYYGDIQRGNFDLTSLQWVGISDPHHYFVVFDSKMTPPHGFNRGGYSNPLMDRLVEAGEVTLDQTARRKIYAGVQRLAAADLPYVSLFWTDNIAVMRSGFSGFVPYPNGSLRSLATIVISRPPQRPAQQASR
jgi:peptide/nickel transport system substrate-binding protein